MRICSSMTIFIFIHIYVSVYYLVIYLCICQTVYISIFFTCLFIRLFICQSLSLEVQQNTGIPVRTGVSRAYRYGSAVRYVPVHSGVFGSLFGNCRSSVARHCLTSV